jgi:hypothetical protein
MTENSRTVANPNRVRNLTHDELLAEPVLLPADATDDDKAA